MNKGRLSDEFRGRTKGFAAGVIRLVVRLPRTREEVRVLGRQLLRSGTSVAAHVREASRARSDDEFISKLGGCLAGGRRISPLAGTAVRGMWN
jgi:four helix bundle protein